MQEKREKNEEKGCLKTVTMTGGMRMGIVGREGVGEFDTEIKRCEGRDETGVLPVGIEDGCHDALERKTVTGVGEHEQTDRIACFRADGRETVIEISTDHDIGAERVVPSGDRKGVVQFERQPPLYFGQVECAAVLHREIA